MSHEAGNGWKCYCWLVITWRKNFDIYKISPDTSIYLHIYIYLFWSSWWLLQELFYWHIIGMTNFSFFILSNSATSSGCSQNFLAHDNRQLTNNCEWPICFEILLQNFNIISSVKKQVTIYTYLCRWKYMYVYLHSCTFVICSPLDSDPSWSS